MEQREEACCAGEIGYKTVTTAEAVTVKDRKAEDTMLQYKREMNLSYHYYN
jgi:hypothetical protein